MELVKAAVSATKRQVHCIDSRCGDVHSDTFYRGDNVSVPLKRVVLDNFNLGDGQGKDTLDVFVTVVAAIMTNGILGPQPLHADQPSS